MEILKISISMFFEADIISRLCFMIVRFLSHRKSIFKSPRSSRGFALYCVTTASESLGGCASAVYCVMGSGAIITAHA